MYSTKEISEKLINDGFPEMTVRKINYYAFEKKMFPILGTGKNVFSDADYDKLKSIAFLRENSKYSLEEIKEKIQQHTFQELDNMFFKKTIDEYTTRNNVSNVCHNSLCVDGNLQKDLEFTTTWASTSEANGETLASGCSTTSISYSNSTSDAMTPSNTYLSSDSYTGTNPEFLRSVPYVNPFPSILPAETSFTNEQIQRKYEEDKFKETKSQNKTRIKISKGIFIEYDNNADPKEIEKLINMSKILFE